MTKKIKDLKVWLEEVKALAKLAAKMEDELVVSKQNNMNSYSDYPYYF